MQTAGLGRERTDNSRGNSRTSGSHIGLEARLAEAGDKCVEVAKEGAGEAVGIERRPRVGRPGAGSEQWGRRSSSRCAVAEAAWVGSASSKLSVMAGSSLSQAGPVAAFVATTRRRPGQTGTRRRSRRAAAQRRTAARGFLASRGSGPSGPRGSGFRYGAAAGSGPLAASLSARSLFCNYIDSVAPGPPSYRHARQCRL